MHDDTSTAEGSLTILVDRLDRHHIIRMLDDPHSKTDAAFRVRKTGIRARGPDGPCVKTLTWRRFKLNLCGVEASCAGPPVANEHRRGDLFPLVVVDSEVP